jgi:hypothetical protein
MVGTVDDIRVEVGKVSKLWERVVRERSPPLLPTVPSSSTPPSSTLPASAYVLPQPLGDLQRQSLESLEISSESGRPSAADKTDRPHGHRFDNYLWEDGYGSVTTLVHPLVKGACKLPSPPQSPKFVENSMPFAGHRWRSANPTSAGRLPKMNFLSLMAVIPSFG